jgi:hypothetical protein
VAKYGRFNISIEPSGITLASEDPYPCDSCRRYIGVGQPYWGGGLDYFGEANSVYCARCEARRERNDERHVRDYERQMKAPCKTCGHPNGAHVNYEGAACEYATSYAKTICEKEPV